jgi:hypothetical protein
MMRATMIECVGPRWLVNRITVSASGMTDNARTRGMFSSVSTSFAVAFPRMYPLARCPTANEVVPSSHLPEQHGTPIRLTVIASRDTPDHPTEVCSKPEHGSSSPTLVWPSFAEAFLCVLQSARSALCYF